MRIIQTFYCSTIWKLQHACLWLEISAESSVWLGLQIILLFLSYILIFYLKYLANIDVYFWLCMVVDRDVNCSLKCLHQYKNELDGNNISMWCIEVYSVVEADCVTAKTCPASVGGFCGVTFETWIATVNCDSIESFFFSSLFVLFCIDDKVLLARSPSSNVPATPSTGGSITDDSRKH